MLDFIFVSTLNIAIIYHKNNGYFLESQRNNRSFFSPTPPKKKAGSCVGLVSGWHEENRGRPWPREREGPTFWWEGFSFPMSSRQYVSIKKKRVTPMPYGFWVTLIYRYTYCSVPADLKSAGTEILLRVV